MKQIIIIVYVQENEWVFNKLQGHLHVIKWPFLLWVPLADMVCKHPFCMSVNPWEHIEVSAWVSWTISNFEYTIGLCILIVHVLFLAHIDCHLRVTITNPALLSSNELCSLSFFLNGNRSFNLSESMIRKLITDFFFVSYLAERRYFLSLKRVFVRHFRARYRQLV
jgi:hypothetical protein